MTFPANQHFASEFSMEIFNSRDIVASSPCRQSTVESLLTGYFEYSTYHTLNQLLRPFKERKMIVIQMLNFWTFEGMFVMGGVLCLVRMCCDFGTPDLGERNQQNRTPCFIWYVDNKKCIWWNTLFDIAFQMIKSYLTGFVVMQDFIVKSLKKFSAVFPEVTLQPWVILESIRLLSNLGNTIAKSCFKQWAQMARAYCSFCRIKHLDPVQTSCFCRAEVNCNLVQL